MIKTINSTTKNNQQITTERFQTFLELIRSNSLEQALQDAAILAICQGNWRKVSQLADFAVEIKAADIALETAKSLEEAADHLKYLELPTRINNALKRQGVVTIGELIEWRFEELMTIKGIQVSSAQKIAIALEKKLGIMLPGWTKWQSRNPKDQPRRWQPPQQILKAISS